MALFAMNEADSIESIMPREREVFLMERIASGDQYAMEELIELWKMPMFRFFLRSLNHHEDAEDLTQLRFLFEFIVRPNATFPTQNFPPGYSPSQEIF